MGKSVALFLNDKHLDRLSAPAAVAWLRKARALLQTIRKRIMSASFHSDLGAIHSFRAFAAAFDRGTARRDSVEHVCQTCKHSSNTHGRVITPP